MKRIYLLVLVFGVILFFLNREYRKQYEGLHMLFQVANDLDKKDVFTEAYKPKAIALWSEVVPTVNWETARNEDFLKVLAACLNEFSSYNTDKVYKDDVMDYVVYFETRKPFTITFELLTNNKGVQINEIHNVEELFSYVDKSTGVSAEAKACLVE